MLWVNQNICFIKVFTTVLKDVFTDIFLRPQLLRRNNKINQTRS